MYSKYSCSIVVPVYNSQDSLEELVHRLHIVMTENCGDFEIILVNDGSSDDSAHVIQSLTENYPQVIGIHLLRNYGQHNATLCGIRKARHEITITLDDDLQNPPEEIPKLLGELGKGFDVVYGISQEKHQNLWRSFASNLIRFTLQMIMHNDIAWKVSSFRAFHTSIRNSFEQYSSPNIFIDVLLTWGAARFNSILVRQEMRPIGKSSYSFRKLIGLVLTMITGFSTLPLRAASMAGFFFTLFGFSVLVYVVGRYFLTGGSIPGFPFLASIIAIFSGATLFSLGIIGEYMARLYIHIIGQPSYVVIKETGQGKR